MTLFLAFVAGWLSGLRTGAPVAIVAWAAYLGWLKLPGPLALIGSDYAVAFLTAFALAELAADKWWAKIPDRTSPPALIARLLTGGLMGACIAAAGGAGVAVGAAIGAVAAVIGTFAGFHARRHLTKGKGLPDLPVALAEDTIVIAGCLWAVTRFS
jgi:uncharacterized membrane protein